MPLQPGTGSSPTQLRRALETQATSDPVLQTMLNSGGPLTREDYIQMAYPGNRPDPWTAEHEAELPEAFQQRDET